MTNPIRTTLGGALVAAVLLPSPAFAGQGGHHHRGHHHRGHASARTEKRVERVDLSLEKAIDAIDDGDDAKAAAKLASVDKNLARALKAATAQLHGDKGPGSFALVATTADDVALTTADAMDGASQALTDSLEGSLDGALDTRDAIVAATATAEDYGDVLDEIADDSDGEVESFDEGIADDTLTASGKTALTDASTQAAATSTTARAAADAADDGDDEGDDEGDGDDGDDGDHGDEDDDEDRPHGGGGHGGHGPSGPDGGPTGPTGPSGSQESPRFRG